MTNITINQLDYRYLLVDLYKEFGLNEKELAVLLVCDNLLKDNPILITRELLSLKMTLPLEELDSILVDLIEKNFLKYDSNEHAFVTSIKPTYEKITEHFEKNLLLNREIRIDKDKEASAENIYAHFEKTLGRSLTSIEFEKIKEWVSLNIPDDIILSSLDECASKKTKVSLVSVDKIIMKRMSSNDIKSEGYTPLNEKWKKDIEKTIDIANTDWIK